MCCTMFQLFAMSVCVFVLPTACLLTNSHLHHVHCITTLHHTTALHTQQASQAADSAAKSITNPSRWGQKWQAASNTGKANTAKPSGTTLNNGFTSSLKDAVSSVQDALPNTDDVNVPSGIKDAGRQVKNKVCIATLLILILLTVLELHTVWCCYLDSCEHCCL
jgi:hypothetical protein